MTNQTYYYKAYDVKGNWGVCGTYDSAEKVLDKINQDYVEALEKGYDNRNEKFVIVIVYFTTEKNDYDELVSRTMVEHVIWKVSFSEDHQKFVRLID